MATMASSQTVYYGPSSSAYAKNGNIASSTFVTVLWKEGSWYYIQYGSGSSTTRGYVPVDSVNNAGGVSSKTLVLSPRYVQVACDVYFGPNSTGYAKAGEIEYGETVQFLNEKDEKTQYAFVEYHVSKSTLLKRAWIYANNLMITMPKIYRDPVEPYLIYTMGTHYDYPVVKGTPVYAMCDGTFKAIYCLGIYKPISDKVRYVSLGIGGYLYPKSGWTMFGGNTYSEIHYGHLQSLKGYTCPSFSIYGEQTKGSSRGDVTDYQETVLGTKTVSCGDLIGYSGTTGNSSGPHLHIQAY